MSAQTGRLNINRTNNSWLTPADRPNYDGIDATLDLGGRSYRVFVLVSKTDQSNIVLRIPELFGDPSWGGSAVIRHMDGEPGVATGSVVTTAHVNHGIVLVRE